MIRSRLHVNQVGYLAGGPYLLPAARARVRALLSHTTPSTAFRGFGTPQLAWATESQLDEASRRLGIDPVRLRLLSLVAANDEVCSCDLQGPLGKSQPTVSHHTKALAEAGLITGEKRGRWVYWRVVPERVDALRAALTAP